MSLRGTYRGFETRPAEAARRPKRLARASNAATAQTGITTVTDLTGLSISFAVTDFPVKVRLLIPFAYGSAVSGQVYASITDLSNTIKSDAGITAGVANGALILGPIEEEITVPGSYSRKGRLRLNAGSGNANTFVDPTFVALIEAIEYEV